MVKRSIFEQIFKEMQYIRFKLEDLDNRMTSLNSKPMDLTESELISLPDHLRKTYLAVASKGECGATQVSRLTRRCRAIESSYLNQLVRMGWLNKCKVSNKTQFCLTLEKQPRSIIASTNAMDLEVTHLLTRQKNSEQISIQLPQTTKSQKYPKIEF